MKEETVICLSEDTEVGPREGAWSGKALAL